MQTQTQTQPGPVPHFDLDHLMLKVDDLAAARAAMGRLGFTTSPYRTNDPMGGGRTGGRGGNHLVLFEPLVPDTTNMLELAYCDVPHAMPAMREVLGGPQGFAMLVVSPADLRALRAWWTAQGFDFSPVIGQRFDWQDPETGQREVDEVRAAVVRRIFEDFVANGTVHGIAKRLNEQGVPAFAGGRWHALTVRRILLNETYTGRTIYRRTVVKKVRDAARGRWVRRVEERDESEWIEIEGAGHYIHDDCPAAFAQAVGGFLRGA